MTVLRILHLSDFHLAGIYRAYYETINTRIRELSVYNLDALRATAKIVYRWRDDIDAILITGDIAIMGTDTDLRSAIEFFISPPSSFSTQPWLNNKREPTLKTFAKPIMVIPGNHDRYRNLSGWPGHLFYRYFSSFWDASVGGVKSWHLPNKEAPILAIVSGDFSLDSIFHRTVRFGHFGQGKIYDERLNGLVAHTKDITSSHPSCAVIWALHFAPKFEDHYPLAEDMRLIDADLLIKEAKKAGVRYILCGHTHQNRYYTQSAEDAPEVLMLCSGTSTCIRETEDTTIHLRDIEIDNGRVVKIKSLDFKWDPDNQTFLP